MLHDAIAIAVALLCLSAIIAPSVPTGVIITLGLGIVGGGALYSIDYFADQRLVSQVLLSGQGIVLCGALVRRWRGHRSALRRIADWDRWPQTRPPHEISEQDHRHVTGGKGGQ